MIDWELAVKPLLSGNPRRISVADATHVIKAIISNKEKILDNDVLHECFYSLFVTLAGQALPGCFVSLDKALIGQAAQACKILIEYCVSRIVNYDSQRHQTAVSQNHLVFVLLALCVKRRYPSTGEHEFRRPDIIAFIALIKSAKLPMLVKKDTTETVDNPPELPEEDKKESDQNISDLFSIFQNDLADLNIGGKDLSKNIEHMNVRALQDLAVEHNLLKCLLDLPYLKRYIGRHQSSAKAMAQGEWKALILPSTQKEAASLANEVCHLQKNVHLVKDALDLPILEPYDEDQLTMYIDLVLGCLCAAINVTAAVAINNQSPQQFEDAASLKVTLDAATDIVKCSLSLCRNSESCLSHSPHSGQDACKELRFTALSHLYYGLQSIHKNVKEKTASSLMFMALAQLTVNTMKDAIEIHMNNLTTTQEFAFLVKQYPIVQLSLKAAAVFFNEVHPTTTEEPAPKSTDTPKEVAAPETEKDEDGSLDENDENSDDSDDDGPLIGEWLNAALSPEDSPPPVKSSSSYESAIVLNSELPTIDGTPLAEKSTSSEQVAIDAAFFPELTKFGPLMIQFCLAVKHVTDDLVLSKVDEVRSFVARNLDDESLAVLAQLIERVDGESEVHSGESLMIMDLAHKLLWPETFPFDRRQEICRKLLGRYLDKEHQLFHPPFAASIFAQYLIQAQQESKRNNADSQTVVTFLHSLVDYYSKSVGKEEKLVGVHYFQLAILLFHTLTETGKQNFLLKVAEGLMSLGERSTLPVSTSRLLVLLDYLLHEYSTPPEQLLHQVRWNFQAVCGVLTRDAERPEFDTTSQRFDKLKLSLRFSDVAAQKEEPKPADKDKDKDKQSKDIASLIFPIQISRANREAKAPAAKKAVEDDRPGLFELSPNAGNAFEDEKRAVDHQAFDILLRNPEWYNSFYDACVTSLEAGSHAQSAEEGEDDNLTYCTFQLAWRVVKALPQSEAFEQMMKNCEVGKSPSHYLVMLHHLVKQLLGNTSASTPTATTSPTPGDIPGPEKTAQVDEQLRHLVKLCEAFLGGHYPPESSLDDAKGPKTPNSIELMVLECMLTHTQVQLWSKFIKSMDNEDPYDALPMIGDLLKLVLKAVTFHAALCRSHILKCSARDENSDSCADSSSESLDALLRCVDVDTTRSAKESTNVPLPLAIARVIAEWSGMRKELKEYKNTGEENVNNSMRSHFRAISAVSSNSASKALTTSFLLLEDPLHRLCDDLVVWVRDSSSPMADLVCDTLIPLLSDVTCMDGHDQLKQALEKITGGPRGSDPYDDTLNFYALKGAYTILTKHIDPTKGINNKSVAVKYITFLQESLDMPSMQRAMNKFFVPDDSTKDGDKQKTDKFVAIDANETDVDKATFKGKSSDDRGSIVELLLSNRLLATSEYSNKLLQFVAKLCKLANGKDAVACLQPVCAQLGHFNLTLSEMREWISNFDLDAESSSGGSLREEISAALLTLSRFVVSPNSQVDQQLALCLLDAILPVETCQESASASLQAISPTFVVILATLANARGGTGHRKMLAYALWWLEACAEMLREESNAKLMHAQEENDITRAVATCSSLLVYVSNVLTAVESSLSDNAEAVEEDDSDLEDALEVSYDPDCDFDEHDADLGKEEDSHQDEEELWNKLCTYTITQKKFMNQHWYHCHTCDMVEGVGVCTVCAKVCHKGHDLTYAKFGSFFCDCGAKDNKSCKALVKRVPGSDKLASGVSAFSDISRPASASTSAASNFVPPSTSVSATSHKTADSKESTTALANAAAQKLQNLGTFGNGKRNCIQRRTPSKHICGKPLVVESSRDQLLAYIRDPSTSKEEEEVLPEVEGVIPVLLRVLRVMKNVVHTEDYKLNSTGSTLRALKAIEDLHKLEKPVNVVDTLMVPTLGSQEGAFENVKANFTGEQGQTIRQLINSRYIRRVAMCCLATTSGRRQHLAVSHEKTKVTLLQLSALLKQANVSKRKLTLTRLSTTAMPFAVTTITANSSNEEVLAVCGLKDCHVLTYASAPAAVTPSGSVTQHLVLHPQLATNNYIIRAVWLPASPTMLALVTADFIKIYDLAKDVLSPCYYLLLPTGKIRDATFVGGMRSDRDTCIVVMSSTGYIYTQTLNDESLALHGTFYLTNVLSVVHPQLKEGGGQVGGVSVYYSHSLKLLFFSYSNGRNFAGTMDASMESVTTLFPIQYKANNGSSGRNGSNNTLYEWSEVVNHPGLVFSFSQSQGCPVVVMVEPDKISLQEIKGLSAKAKIQDLVAVRHAGASPASSSAESGEKTTIIVLCEDGSLRIYLASADGTEYWLQPKLQPTVVLGGTPTGRTKAPQQSSPNKEADSEDVLFPIDFFEYCQAINNTDLEFGGQPLEVYNAAQIKNRLNSTGMYIMGKNDMTMTITNKSTNMVMTGIRVLVGTKGSLSAPCSIVIGDERLVSLGPRINKARWFDLPLTRAESIAAHNNTLRVTFGISEHPDDNNIVDNIKVYGKTKEVFGWPQDDAATGKISSATQVSNGSKSPTAKAQPVAGNGSDADSDISGESQVQQAAAVSNTGVADEFLLSCMTALHSSFTEKINKDIGAGTNGREMALEVTSKLLTEPLSPRVLANLKFLMKKLFDSKDECYRFMDQVLLKHVAASLKYEEDQESSSATSTSSARIDEDSFQRSLQILSVIARRRPLNVTPFQQDPDDVKVIDLESGRSEDSPRDEEEFHGALLRRIMSAFWRLLANKPRSKLLVPPCLPGLTRIEMTVKVIVDIVHAVSASVRSTMDIATEIYHQLLTHSNPRVRFAAKSALVRLLRVTSASGGLRVMRSISKSSDTPPSTRSASPPSIASSQTTARVSSGTAAERNQHLASIGHHDHPGSHISSHGTAGGTIDDDEGDEDDDDDDEDDDDDDDEGDDDDRDDDDDDDDDEDNYESLQDIQDAMEIDSIREHNPIVQGGHDYYEEGLLPGSVPDEHSHNFEQLLMGGHPDQDDQLMLGGHGAEQGAPGAGGTDEDRRSTRVLAMDMMRAMAAEAEAAEEEEGNDLENMLMGIDFPHLLPPDVDDDEAMVEYAIALSLQQQGQQDAPTPSNPEPSAEQRGSSGSQQARRSGSISDGGSSSASDAGDPIRAPPVEDPHQEEEHHSTSSARHEEEEDCMEEDIQLPVCQSERDRIGPERLEEIRITLLRQLFSRLDDVEKLGGEHSIPFFQVLSTLISTLDFNNDEHVALHRHIVVSLVERLNVAMKRDEEKEGEEKEKGKEGRESISVCTPSHEVFVVIMRLLSIMMSRSHGTSPVSIPQQMPSDALAPPVPTSLHDATIRILAELKIVKTCFELLSALYEEQWQKQGDQGKLSDVTPPSNLLKSAPSLHPADMTPFFLRQYVQSHAGAIFEPYLRLITEMALNLAYQVRKHATCGQEIGDMFDGGWRQLLSEFMLFPGVLSLVRRRARKLLLYITGSKEKYRMERDLYALDFHISNGLELIGWRDEKKEGVDADVTETEDHAHQGLSLSYNDLISLVETLRKCREIAQSRVRNWQHYCVSNPSCLAFLMDTSLRADENVASHTLKLLLCAIARDDALPCDKEVKLTKSASKGSVASVKGKNSASSSSGGDKTMSQQLSQQMVDGISDEWLTAFLRHFLLEMNSSSIRWSAHALVLNMFRNTKAASQHRLLNGLWKLCSQASSYGQKASQFIDLLGYLSMNMGLDQETAKSFTDVTLQVLRTQNRLLSNHQNAILYGQLANYVQFDGFFLESNPCLVCNQLEAPLSNMKLANIKSDMRYTTTQQIVKLVGSYAVQKVTVKLTDIKRTKMIRTAVLYYNNKRVPAIVDLKNNPSMWHKAKSITVPQGEPEIRFDLPLPIVATNLMLEFTDFYENVSASIETLQCPRCSASVQANPGICSNCGENVFQCHKCRSINYDEKDPFLCNVCGFSKYAKFDVTVTAKQCCAVDSIENDEDRKKMVASVVALLEKADAVYNQLNAHKPQLEALLLQISHISSDAPATSDPGPLTRSGAVKGQAQKPLGLGGAVPLGVATTPVSSSIQQLAKKYCQECRSQFEELTTLMRTVLASRSEIVDYDRRQRSAISGNSSDSSHRHVPTSSWGWSQSAPDCYGCASASAQQCVTLLRVLSTNQHAKPLLVESGIVRELVMYNLRRGTPKSRAQVRSLISQLITNNRDASHQLNDLLLSRITGAINHHGDELPPSAVACEMQLLTATVNVRDQLWQLRLRAVMQLFQMSLKKKSPAVVENVTLPCVHMLRKLVAPEGKDAATSSAEPNIAVEAKQWMSGETEHSYEAWTKRRGHNKNPQPVEQEAANDKQSVRHRFLEEKFFEKWKKFVLAKKNQGPQEMHLSRHPFLRTMLFCPTSRSIRQAACAVVTSLAKNTTRKPQVLDLLTSYLDELGNAGEAASEFLKLYQDQIRPKQWRVYLASRGLLPLLGSLIQKEIAKLAVLEEKTLNLQLQQGYALKELTELLSAMVQVSYVRQHYKGKLVGTVLNSYLSLRRLVIQRTNLVDDAQDVLLELLEELTTGTESETRAFMAVCIEAIKKQDLSDLKTPQFIFERLANIIYPEENDTSEFFLSLDKDPLQEDFLQGRMVGNPYSSNEAGLGPLMRDVKNKICRDCDLIALLEDDSGMELLINNKIIALDLPVRDVYKKIWLPNHTEDDAMHVVYRMRGLLGEATEDIVERLDSDKTDQNEEEVYKLASVLSECGGVEVMLTRLESVRSLLHGRQLVEVILKLLSHATKLKVNRQYLARPRLNTLNILLGSLNLGLQAGEDGVQMIEQLLKLMASVLQEAAAEKTNLDEDAEYLTGDKEKLTLLLQQIDSEFVQGHTNILQGILRIIPFLSFGDPDLMQLLIDHFISTLDFEKFDEGHSDDETIYMNCFCDIVAGIHTNDSGDKLKELMVKNDIVQNAVAYLIRYVPEDKNFESDDWKAVTARPSLPFCLRILTGLCSKHKSSQQLVGLQAVQALHRLEQISSQESIGPHAENVLEALQEHPDVAKQIKEVRRQTREEKKKRAMAIREKQLGSLGMKTNDKGQMITKSAILQQISDLVEETGLTCIICREGYKFEPKKVLGVYTYTRRCPLEEFEAKARKSQGYSTVSHFNVVHYECHTSAVRTARGREEWDSALLQNTNTKCNGLLPLWGAQVPEAAFASCLARHNTYIQEATGQREPGFHSTVHDLKLLVLRFASERSFSEETGGGGRQSNINLMPYLIHTGLYVVNSTRSQAREERTIADFLASFVDKWVESSYEVDGPLYVAAMMPFLFGVTKWKEARLTILKRLLVVAQCRKTSPNMTSKLVDRDVKEYAAYKPYLLFWALIELIITTLFKNSGDEGGCTSLANYIRNNDTQLLDGGEKMLAKFQDELIVCESLGEFGDVMGLLEEMDGDVTAYVRKVFDGLPT